MEDIIFVIIIGNKKIFVSSILYFVMWQLCSIKIINSQYNIKELNCSTTLHV